MKKTIVILVVGLFSISKLWAQETTFYKDENMQNKTIEKKAKFIRISNFKGDTLVTQSWRISDNLLFSESKKINNTAVGIWIKKSCGSLYSLTT